MRLFFLFIFIEAPSIFTFCEQKALLKVSALCDLPETFIKKILKKFRKKLFSIFCFLKVYGWESCFFSVVSSWRRMVFEIYAYPFGIMWRCKIDEILTVMSFYPWLSIWYCLFGFFFNFLRKLISSPWEIAPMWFLLPPSLYLSPWALEIFSWWTEQMKPSCFQSSFSLRLLPSYKL